VKLRKKGSLFEKGKRDWEIQGEKEKAHLEISKVFPLPIG